MKPKFWIAKADFASLTDADEGCDALHQCATISREGCKLLPDDAPLYTADQLAEAVAAERERCAKVCEAHSNSALCHAMSGGPDAEGLQHMSNAHQRAAISIRSAAK